ncbi:MAG: IS1595 family transposase [Longimicrobiales bacterium]
MERGIFATMRRLSLPRKTKPMDLQDVLSAVRDARFAQGLRCPRCTGAAIQRWGSFSGRQRYRCGKCRRTFSDLTLTAAAYTKRLQLWPRYMICMLAGETIRCSAARTGIHACTAFRWRHRILQRLDAADGTELTGLVEVEETGFPHSEKGRRNLPRPARRHGYWPYAPRTLFAPYVCVLTGCDRYGSVISSVVLRRHPYDRDVHQHVMARVRGPSTIMARYRVPGHYSRATRQAGHNYVQVPHFALQADRPMLHTFNVDAYIRRLRAWLPRFRGVATRYLQHYLAWHRLIDAIGVHGGTSAMIRSLHHPRKSAE